MRLRKKQAAVSLLGKGTIQQSSLSLQATPPHLQCKTDPAEIVFTRQIWILFGIFFASRAVMKQVCNSQVRLVWSHFPPKLGKRKKKQTLETEPATNSYLCCIIFHQVVIFPKQKMVFRILFLPKKAVTIFSTNQPMKTSFANVLRKPLPRPHLPWILVAWNPKWVLYLSSRRSVQSWSEEVCRMVKLLGGSSQLRFQWLGSRWLDRDFFP